MSEYQSIYTYSHALVIGINDYRCGLRPLGEAEGNARRLASILSQEPYNFTVETLFGEDASRNAILAQLAMLEETDINSRILFYFAGHGYTLYDRYGYPTGFLAAHDTTPDQRYTAIRLDEITELTRLSPAKHISFIFDSCYSAAALGLIAPRDNATAEQYLISRVYQALTAGEAEVDDTRSMTEYILEILKIGQVDPGTGLFTLRQVADHVRRQMEHQRRVQRPVLGYLDGSNGGEYVFLVDTGPRLSYDLEMARRSKDNHIRWGAVASLIDLARDEDQLAEIAVRHLKEMAAADPDERVQGAAQSYFRELETRQRAEEGSIRKEQLEKELAEIRHRQAEAEEARRQVEEALDITPWPEMYRPIESMEPDEPEPELTSEETKRTLTFPNWKLVSGLAAIVGIIGLTIWLGGSSPPPTAGITATPTDTPRDTATATAAVPTTVPVIIAPDTATPTQEIVVTLNPTYEAPTSILYVSKNIYHYDLFTFNVNNNELRNLTASNYNDYQPSISPNGDLIAFSSNRGGNYEIYLTNLIGMDQTLLVNDPGKDEYPTWSPDGDQIAFVSDRSGKKEIYIINVEKALQSGGDSEVRRITWNQLAEEHLSWSPGGQYIVFHATISGNPEIFRVAVEGDSSEAEQLTFNDAKDKNPTYLPDGRISFESNRDGIYEVYIMHANGSSETRITQNDYDNLAPYWTPDGLHLVFHSQREGDDSYEIYFIDLEQPYVVTGQEELHRLTHNDEDDQNPIWLPVSESP